MTPAEKIIVVEKLASSEIAQSRERFVQILTAKGWDCHIDTVVTWEIWQWAERDTRERVAQQLTDFVMEAGNMASGKWPITISDVLELAERIRGKESA